MYIYVFSVVILCINYFGPTWIIYVLSRVLGKMLCKYYACFDIC